MARSEPTTVLAALGFSPSVERTYEQVLRHSGQRLAFVAAAMLRSPEQLMTDLEPLLERQIVRAVDGRVHVEPPAQALARLIVELSKVASHAHAELTELASAVPLLADHAARPAVGDVHDVLPIDGEVTAGADPRSLVAALARQGNGDLCWLRPDQWRVFREAPVLEIIREVVASGRRSRAIYPVRVLREAPEVVQARAEAGEQIRVLPEVPTRMFVMGATHAVLPEPLGFFDGPLTLVRQQGIVEALGLLFEMMWERASPVPELEQRDGRPDLRAFLLRQLATGAQDEQIARQLGLSLRTVRRRVADLMSELGADSRFQAGVEAVRRGWL